MYKQLFSDLTGPRWNNDTILTDLGLVELVRSKRAIQCMCPLRLGDSFMFIVSLWFCGNFSVFSVVLTYPLLSLEWGSDDLAHGGWTEPKPNQHHHRQKKSLCRFHVHSLIFWRLDIVYWSLRCECRLTSSDLPVFRRCQFGRTFAREDLSSLGNWLKMKLGRQMAIANARVGSRQQVH